MELLKALRFTTGKSVAFVGAGGKTSAIFTIAFQIRGPVIVTTTTHMFISQTQMGDNRWSVIDRHSFEKIKPEIMKGGVHVLISDTFHDERAAGPDENILEDISKFCRQNNIALLIEADGSKMRPVKAPAAHEPAIPSWIDTVVVCSGLSAVGAELNETHVHRPENFSKITGRMLGSKLTYEDLKNELLSTEGGLKGIPINSRIIALFNQADTPEIQSGVQTIADDLLEKYSAVVVSKSTGLSAKGNPNLEAIAVHENCAGIILAAGKSSRMGTSGIIKQLMDWHGKPFIRQIVETALKAGLEPICVVTGADDERIRQVLDDLPLIITGNPDWEKGQSTSVRAGINSLPESTGGALFLMSDQPQIEVTLIRSLVEKHKSTLSPIIAPMIDGRRGNPVLFDRTTFHELTDLHGDTGGRELFSKYNIDWLPWADAAMLLDVDTPEDYEKLIRMDKDGG